MTQTTRIGQQFNPALIRDVDLGAGSRLVGTGYTEVLEGMQQIVGAMGLDTVATIAAALTARVTALASAPALLGPTASLSNVDNAKVGETLSIVMPKVDAVPQASIAYQWQKGASTNISGATSAQYTLAVGELAANVKCKITYSNGVGSNLVITTAATNAVLAADA